jgi:hypothetical protein
MQKAGVMLRKRTLAPAQLSLLFAETASLAPVHHVRDYRPPRGAPMGCETLLQKIYSMRE